MILLTPEPNALALTDVVAEEPSMRGEEVAIVKEQYWVQALPRDYKPLLHTMLEVMDADALCTVLLYLTTPMNDAELLNARRHFDQCGIHTVAWADRHTTDLLV